MDRVIDGITYTVLTPPRQRWWGINDVYTGPDTGTYIVAEGDVVTDTITGDVYSVVDVDPLTGIAKLQHSVNTACQTNLWAYYDTNTTPTSIVIDGTYTVTGDISYAIAYNGVNDYTNSMSETYHSDGTLDTDRIPVRRVASDSHESHSVYNIDRFHTTDTLTNGSLITLVVFDIYGNLVSKRIFTLSDVSPLNDALACSRAIRSVALVTPFMTDGDLIRRPITIGVNDLNIVVEVTYTDGESELLGVDHDRVTIAGMDVVSLNNTALNHDIMLIYRTMGDPVNGPLESNGIITVGYHLRNYIPSLSYNHQLQIYPEYINQTEGYRMVGYLHLADRSIILDVTPYLDYVTPLDGLLLDDVQHIEATLDLKYVHIVPDQHTVTTEVWVTIRNYGGTNDPGWSMSGVTEYIVPYSKSTAVGVTTIQITNDSDEWWNRVYPSTNPMLISGIEMEPPRATHLRILDTLNGDVIVHRSDITQPLTFHELQLNDVVHVEFIQQLGNDVLVLSHLPIFI